MSEEIKYKVLWVDDDESIIDSFATLAEENYDISLDVAANWEIAEEKLRIYFKEYSAIILDAQCKLKKSDSKPSEFFLGQVSVRLSRIFGEKHEFIPWYVLSAGTMDSFQIITDLINTEERKKMDPIWGNFLYFKDSSKGDSSDKLFKKITEVASDRTINKVLFRHADVFKYLGEGNSVNYILARNYILKMLSALYNPEENLNYEFEGNPLRKVLEYIFHTANDCGLLPDDCLYKKGCINLANASRYMAGRNADCYNNSKTYQVRFGNPGKGKEGSGGDCIFDSEIADLVRNILNYTNNDSHTGSENIYVIKEDKKEIFFGYVLQLCHVIKWFGKYLEKHPNKEENLEKLQIIGKKNSQKETKAETSVPNDNSKTDSASIEIPSIESFIGETGIIISDEKGHNVLFGAYCKVDDKYKKDIGRNIKVVSLIENPDAGSDNKPYIITDLEFLN